MVELVETTNRHGEPHLAGRIGAAAVAVFPCRERPDGRRVWRMVVRPADGRGEPRVRTSLSR